MSVQANCTVIGTPIGTPVRNIRGQLGERTVTFSTSTEYIRPKKRYEKESPFFVPQERGFRSGKGPSLFFSRACRRLTVPLTTCPRPRLEKNLHLPLTSFTTSPPSYLFLSQKIGRLQSFDGGHIGLTIDGRSQGGRVGFFIS